MNKYKTAVILINVGSPEKAEKLYVKKFLNEFLNDKEVIDIPWILRKILVNLIIIPFRTNKSTALYKRLWTQNGSPLIFYSKNVENKLNNIITENIEIFSAMRYGKPSISEALSTIKNKKFDNIIVFPLYPQYSTSTTKTAIDTVINKINLWNIKPKINIIRQFYNHPMYINALCAKIQKYNLSNFDHIIFSYHGLPIRHINKSHPKIHENNCECHKEMPTYGEFCYKACCYKTTRLIAKELNIKKEFYSTSFQSNLSNKWTKPFTSDIIVDMAKNNLKKILVIAPSFVNDCLETSIEIADDYNLLFKSNGGEKLQLVDSLNDSDLWISALKNIIEEVSFKYTREH